MLSQCSRPKDACKYWGQPNESSVWLYHDHDHPPDWLSLCLPAKQPRIKWSININSLQIKHPPTRIIILLLLRISNNPLCLLHGIPCVYYTLHLSRSPQILVIYCWPNSQINYLALWFGQIQRNSYLVKRKPVPSRPKLQSTGFIDNCRQKMTVALKLRHNRPEQNHMLLGPTYLFISVPALSEDI